MRRTPPTAVPSTLSKSSAEQKTEWEAGQTPGLLFSAFLHTQAFLKIRVTDPELHGEVLERFRETFQISRVKAGFFLKTVLLAYLAHLNAVPAAPPEALARFIASGARTQFYDILVPELVSRRGGGGGEKRRPESRSGISPPCFQEA